MPKKPTAPVCPIPADAKPGDVIVCRNGVICHYGHISGTGNIWSANGEEPVWCPSGKNACDIDQWDCVEFREASSPAKPKPQGRPDKDAVWLMSFAPTGKYRRRFLAIARRLNGGKRVLVTEVK